MALRDFNPVWTHQYSFVDTFIGSHLAITTFFYLLIDNDRFLHLQAASVSYRMVFAPHPGNVFALQTIPAMYVSNNNQLAKISGFSLPAIHIEMLWLLVLECR